MKAKNKPSESPADKKNIYIILRQDINKLSYLFYTIAIRNDYVAICELDKTLSVAQGLADSLSFSSS